MKKIMFVCKKNSARSQMAEGFAKQLGAGQVEVTSSGLEASFVQPNAIAAMQDVDIDISDQTSNALSEFSATDYDAVISLCGCGVSLPQEWVLREVFEDWELEDPAGKSLEVYRHVRDQIKERVSTLLSKLS
jgi:arsenate reductase